MKSWRGALVLVGANVLPACIALFLPGNIAPWISCVLITLNAALLVFMCSTVIIGGIGQKRGPGSVAIVSLGALAAMLLHFAIIYRWLGLTRGDAKVESIPDALYFSVVTWTSLGYGDILPSTTSQPVVIAEALMGYLVMAVLVAAFLSAINRNT